MLNKFISIIRTYTDAKKSFSKYDIYKSYKEKCKNAKSYDYYKKIITSTVEEILLEYDYSKKYYYSNDAINILYKPSTKSKIKTIFLNVDSYGRIYIPKCISKYLNVAKNEIVQKRKYNNSIIISSTFNSKPNTSYIFVNKYNGFNVSIGKEYSILNNVRVDIYNNKLEIII